MVAGEHIVLLKVVQLYVSDWISQKSISKSISEPPGRRQENVDTSNVIYLFVYLFASSTGMKRTGERGNSYKDCLILFFLAIGAS